ncbi:GNAT family N-acetyltransferase [Nocardioides sp. GCM10027113]|uniref:GNAT family N-acetyltransferase n=1 Tax=unclassified Nocardioides TaxID=2615069 RepID=UPI00361B894F
MSPAPTLTDGTVTLRAHRPDDAQGSFEQCSDPLSQAWTTVPVPYAYADAEHYVGTVMPKGWADDTEWGFALEVDGRYAGTMSLRNEGHGRAEVAFGSHPWVRGKGHVERGLRLLLAWGFEERDLHTVVWWANRGNWASRRLAWRLGFSFDGTVRRWLPQRGELLDGWVGTLLREDSREPRTAWLDCPVLEAGDLRLRPLAPSDLQRVVEACAHPHTQFWLAGLPRAFDAADGAAYLEDVTERLATGKGISWAVVEEGTEDLLLGVTSLFDVRIGRECELGFWSHPDGRGRGLMTRAAELAIRHAFGALDVQRLSASATVTNCASRALLERVGMRPTGVSRQAARTGDGAVLDLARYELLASERADRPRT